MLIITFMLMSIIVVIVAANPIIPGRVYLWGEKIDTTITYTGESMSIPKAFVTGTYTMVVKLSPPENATMYYPVHPDSTNISIKIDGTPLDWTWNNTYYRITVDGWFIIDFPIINFTISPVPTSFTITASYEHIVPTHDSYLTFLYAYGSARVGQNPKLCDANITTYISKDITGSTENIEAYLLTYVGEMEPAAYTITSVGNTWKVNYFEANTFGWRDYLITIGANPTLTIHSSPTGVTFTVDGVSRTTPWTENYFEGTSVNLEMPVTHDGYIWDRWSDTDTNRIKTVTMDTNITLTGVFAYVPPPPVGGKATPIVASVNKLTMLAPYIGLTILLAVAVISAIYVKKRKKQ